MANYGTNTGNTVQYGGISSTVSPISPVLSPVDSKDLRFRKSRERTVPFYIRPRMSSSSMREAASGSTRRRVGVVTVHLADQFGSIQSEHLNKDGSTTLKFSGGETLHVHNVTLDFGGQSDKF